MEGFPQPVQRHLRDIAFGGKPIACVELDGAGRLCSHHGDFETFGLELPPPGTSVEDELYFLTGMLDFGNLPLELSFVEMPSGISTDVYLFAERRKIWVVLVGVEASYSDAHSVRQRVNELRLTHWRQSRILNQYLGEEVARRLEVGLETIEPPGERRRLTIMFADIRGFTSFSEKSRPEDVFESLNDYLGAMIPAIIENNGVIDKIIGDEVMAIFGMLADDRAGAMHGLHASLQMLRAIEKLNRARRRQGVKLLHIGIGMATGAVSLGVLGSRQRKSITVIGNHVNLAARLQGIAGPNQLVIDAATRESLPDWHDRFTPRRVDLKGFSAPVDVYRLDLEDAVGSAAR